MKVAIAELKELVRSRYPGAKFSVEPDPGDDPEMVWLRTEVEFDDIWDIIDLVSERMADMQVEGIPISILPVLPPHRLAEQLAENKASRPLGKLPHNLSPER